MASTPMKLFIRASDALVKFDAKFGALGDEQLTLYYLEIHSVEIKKLWKRVVTTYETLLKHIDATADSELGDIDAAEGKYDASYDAYVRCLGSINERLQAFRCRRKVDEKTTSRSSQQEVAVTQEKFRQMQQVEAVTLPSRQMAGLEDNDSSISEVSIRSSIPSQGRSSVAPALDVVHNMNLPVCDTDIFRGDFLSWPAFRDLFTAIYINNARLSDIERLCHLVRKTSGDARDIVSKFPLTNSSFAHAWRELKATYENSRILVNEQLRKLFSIPAVEQETSAGLKSLQRGINGCLSALSVYEISTRDWDPILVFLCVQRLPKHTITLWEQSIRDKTAISLWKDLDSFLSERIQTLDCLRGIMGTTATKRAERKGKMHFSNAESSSQSSGSSSDNTSETGTSRRYANVCILCPKHAHSLRSCFRFKKLSLSERFSLVKRSGCCINCLSRSHEVRHCNSKHNCSVCDRRHHTMLHRDSTSSPERPDFQSTAPSGNSNGQTNALSAGYGQPTVSSVLPPSSTYNRQVFHTSQNQTMPSPRSYSYQSSRVERSKAIVGSLSNRTEPWSCRDYVEGDHHS